MSAGMVARGRPRWWQAVLATTVLILVVALVVIQFDAVRKGRQLQRRIEASYEQELLYERLLSLHQDVETGQRGYALTGNPAFLQPFERAVPEIAGTFHQLQRSATNASERNALENLRQLSAEKVAHSRSVVAARNRDRNDAVAIIAAGRGKAIMDSMRVQIGELRHAEEHEQNEGLARVAGTDRSTFMWTVAIEVLLVSLLLVAYVAYLKNFRRLLDFSRRMTDSSKRQAAIFDAAGDAMLVVDEQGRIEGLNPAARDLFARKRDDMVGREVDDFFDGGGVFVAGRNDRRSASRLGDVSKAVGIRGDDDRFDAEISTSHVELEDELRTLMVVRDATERNRMERIKTQFVSTVSHELRTPLTSIRGAIGLLDHDMKNAASDRQRQLLGIAWSNSERLSVLIDDILDVEKLQSGRIDFAMQPVDVRDIVEEAEGNNLTYAADRNVRLITVCQADPLPINGDRGRLLQAFTNLISNAAKFSPEGGVVSIIAEQQEDVARISVADQGPGIPVDFRSRIFDRFSQAERGSRRSGTGLGLAITKEIIERHGGQIGFETAIGRGTRFWIDLPLAEGASE